MLINAIAALRRASPWQSGTVLSPLEVPLYKLKFTIFITLPGTKHASGKRKGHLEWVRMHVQDLPYLCVYLP